MIKKFDLILLSALLIVMNAWYIRAPYGVSWDNSQQFEVFYFFYNHFFFYKDIPQWMPYYSFGIPSHYWQMSFLSPLSYFFILIGSVFHVSNVLLVFKLRLLAEQQVFLLGMYLLSRNLFVSRATVFAVCLGSLASLFSFQQLPFDFSFYYMFPLIIHFFIRFLESRRIDFFWIAGITAFSSVVGNSLYFIFVWIPILLFIGIYLIRQLTGFGILKPLWEGSRKNICFAFVLLGVGFSFFYPLKNFSGFVEYLTRAGDGKNTLLTVLTYTNPDMLQEYCKRFILGVFPASYVGIFFLILFVWGISRLKQGGYHKAFLIALIGLFAFSFAGAWTSLFYFFPGVAYYRHVGYVYGLLKVLILICAGFSLDMFWSTRLRSKVFLMLCGLLGLLFLLDCAGLSNQWLVDVLSKGNLGKGLMAQMNFSSFFFRFGIYVFSAGALILIKFLWYRTKPINPCFVKYVFIVVLCLDIISFQYHMYKEYTAKESPYPKEFENSLRVHKESYRERRTNVPEDERGIKVLMTLSGGIKYANIHSVAQFSPCESQERLDVRPRDVSKLLSAGRNEKNLNEVLGCESPKLRLEAHPLLSGDGNKGQGLFKPAVIGGKIKVKSFHADELVLDVDAPQKGAWLVYADSYHPGWHAVVNGTRQSISRAYLAFKAIHLKGHNTVRFYFNDQMGTLCSYIVMWFGIAVSFFFFGLFLRTIYKNLFL